MSEILLQEANPYGTRIATLENDGRTLYLYLSPPEDLPGDTQAVWVRNLLPAPEETDHAAMQSGQAPLLRREACAHPDGLPAPDNEELDLVWFSEGTGVVLYRNGEAEAAIPPWSGADGLQGYAREALAQDVGTLPLPPASQAGFHDRLRENLEFWTARSQKTHWENFRDRLLAHYEAVYGKHKTYYAVTDRDYPPLAVAEFEVEDGHMYATLGMSNQNMPGVEGNVAGDTPNTRMRGEILSYSAEKPEWLPGVLGRMAIFPWLAGAFFDHGHTYESGVDSEHSNFVLTREFDRLHLPAPGELVLDERYPVNWLLAVPIPQEFFMVAKVRGIEHVLEKLYASED
ncbi:MAG: suppressor of fused domain protein [Leptospirales bacterium]|jgi:hypothetical protein